MKPVAALSSTGFLVGVGVFWAWFAWTCAAEWSRDPEYSYGWVVLPMGVYFLWNRLSAVPRTVSSPMQERFAWLAVFVCAAFVLPIELGRQAPLYWRIFTWAVYGATAIATLSMALLRGGATHFRAAWFPVIFIGSAVPWPTMVEQPVTLGLAHSVAGMVGELLPVLGIPARIEGTVIALPACTVGIAEACSGVRSLQSALMISLAAGELMSLGCWRRVLLIPIGFVLALATNLGRTLALSLAGARGGEAGLNAIHEPAGWVALGVLIAGILLAGRWLRGPSAVREAGIGVVPAGPPEARPTRRWLAAAAVVAIGVAAGQGWYLVHEIKSGDPAGKARLTVKESAEVDAMPLPDYVRRAIGPTDGNYLRNRRPDAAPVTGYHLVWDDSQNNSEALFHRPDVCMPGVGWKLAGKPSTVVATIGGQSVTWAVLPYEKNGVHALMLWAAWLDGEPVRFLLHTGSSVQQNTLMRLIGNGRRTFSYEVAAVMVPYDGTTPPVSEAADAASAIFDRTETPAK